MTIKTEGTMQEFKANLANDSCKDVLNAIHVSENRLFDAMGWKRFLLHFPTVLGIFIKTAIFKGNANGTFHDIDKLLAEKDTEMLDYVVNRYNVLLEEHKDNIVKLISLSKSHHKNSSAEELFNSLTYGGRI